MDGHPGSPERTSAPDESDVEVLLGRLRAGRLPGPPSASVAGDPAPARSAAPQRPADLSGPDARPPSRWRGWLTDRVPVGLRGAALDPTTRGALGLAVLALLAALVAVGLALHGAPRPVTLPAAPSVVGAPAVAGPSIGADVSATSTPPAAGGLVVDVAGKVRHPGVVTLPAGARVADALRLAGGVLPGTDTSALSQARKLTDGEQVLVTGRPGPLPTPAALPSGSGAASDGSATASGGDPGGSSGPTAGATTTGPLDLNTASVEQLDSLPGVGPVLAGRIVEFRTAHNGFTSVDQLREVKGLGGKTGAELLPLVRVN